jgi:serpin B
VCGGLMKDLNTGGKEGKYELNVANALWGQKDYSFSPVYIKLVETEYEGKLQNLDFAQSGEACQTINAWMEKQTKDKIKDLIPSGSLDSSTRLVLTNAIYFKGVWSEPFHEGLTHPGDFKLLDGTVRQVPTMRSAGPVAYFHYETDDLQILCLPYVGDRLDMVVLLPKQTDGITQLEQQLTSENLAKWVASAKKEKVFVFLPKFKATSTLSLAATLASLGMENTFSSLADFSGMTVKPDTLFISDVVHKACVDVDEKGTEAAAATGGGLMGGGGQPFPTFIADHPFIYLIRDRKSGCILFLGRMMDPAS